MSHFYPVGYIGVRLMEDVSGNLFYNLKTDVVGYIAENKQKSSSQLSPEELSQGYEELQDVDNNVYEQSIKETDNNINLFIFSVPVRAQVLVW